MEFPFSDAKASFAIVLPDRMRPGKLWPLVRVALHVVIPMSLLFILMYFLYPDGFFELKRRNDIKF